MHPEKEAIILCRYLTGDDPVDTIIESYAEAIGQYATPLNAAQYKTWSRCIKNPVLLPFADAAWAWTDRLHPLRHRIYIMLSILEAHRKYQHHFLPVERNNIYNLLIALHLLRSGFRLVTGKVLLWFL
jgi:hypothetical protein